MSNSGPTKHMLSASPSSLAKGIEGFGELGEVLLREEPREALLLIRVEAELNHRLSS